METTVFTSLAQNHNDSILKYKYLKKNKLN